MSHFPLFLIHSCKKKKKNRATIREMYSLKNCTVKNSLTLSVPQAVKRGSQILTFCTPSRETRLANKRVECESTIGR